jgi:hypothetical protein
MIALPMMESLVPRAAAREAGKKPVKRFVALSNNYGVYPQAFFPGTGGRDYGISPTLKPLEPLFHVRKDAPPMLVITGDREKELAGRYEENAYFWRMMKLAGHRDIALTELKGHDHGGMAEPAFPALIDFVKRITANPSPQR